MTSRTWHKGPPPHIGWWNASVCYDLTVWRWWNGKCWSEPAYNGDDKFMAEMYAALEVDKSEINFVKWTDYYPKNARVPRINPGVNK